MRFGLRELLFFGLMLGLIVCGYLFVLQPPTEKRALREAEIETRQKALTDLKQATVGVGDLERKIEELQKAIVFFESKLPQEKEIDKILKEVWQMAEANSLQTRTIRTLKSERSAGYSEQPIQMSLAGDFAGFYQFLLQLEKLPRITRVSQMKLEKITDREGEMQAQMTLSIFFEPEGGRRNEPVRRQATIGGGV
jgi:type IV pilus assembly protein PilO